MKPTLCLGFQVHHPLSFVKHDPTDLDEKDIFERMANDVYFPFLTWYHKRLLDYPSLRGMISLSGSFFDYCSLDTQLGDELIDQWRRVITTQRVEVVAEPYHHSLKYLDDPRELLDQILKHHDTIHNLFGLRPTVVRFLKPSNFEQEALLAQYIGFQGFLLDKPETSCRQLLQRPFREEEWEMIKQYAPLDEKGTICVSSKEACVLGANKTLKRNILELYLEGKDGASVCDELWGEMYLEGQEILWLDIEDILTSGKDVGAGLEFLDRFISRFVERGMEWTTPSQLCNEGDILPIDTEEVFAADSIFPEKEDYTHGLQQTAHQEWQSLVEAFEEGDMEVMHDLMKNIEWFARDEHFHSMVSEHSPYDSPYEAFEIYLHKVRELREDVEG